MYPVLICFFFRFCESPISDLDARVPKGRGKRGRGTTNSLGDLSNFTETRSSMHSKLRSNVSGAKGRKGPCSSSPTSFSAPKSESSASKRKTKAPEEDNGSKRKVPPSQTSASISTPVLLECPEPNCSKKYKHINGLKYHQSHAHISPEDEDAKESGVSDEEYQGPSLPPPKDMTDYCFPRSPDNTDCDEPPLPPPPSPPPDNEEKPTLAFRSSDEPSLQATSFPTPFPAASSSSSAVEEPSNPTCENSQSSSSAKKILQFKVKPASELMPEEKKLAPSPPSPAPLIAVVNPLTPSSSKPSHKKKSRKSPVRSPNQNQDPPPLGLEVGRENVQSPAYSDISDDAAPLLESEVEGKPKRIVNDKKESNQTSQLQSYGMYPYYGQPPYLVPSVQSDKPKESPSEKVESKPSDKEKKEGSSEFQQKFLPHNYCQFGYPVSGLPYNFESYPAVVVDGKKDEKTPPSSSETKPVQSSSTQLHIPTINKSKTTEVNVPKEKPPNENHQIIKESIEMKSQMSPTFLYPRQQTQSQDEMRRYYLYPDRKEGTSTKATPPPPPHKSSSIHSPKLKDKPDDGKKERPPEEKKQEGVKPTMETQGPPPPPTSQYAYIHPGYMQSAHYGALPFDPSHPMYRGMNPMLVSGFAPNSYIHPHIPVSGRYHAPEDLSRPQTGKALDLLQHHASQYYTHPTHKIHELQERAIKSPTPKVASARCSPSTVGPPTSVANTATSQTSSKITMSADGKDARSPPPQRHVHTHHHTHVGLGYPILAGQYPAPYGGQ